MSPGQSFDQGLELVKNDPRSVVVWNSRRNEGDIGLVCLGITGPMLVSNFCTNMQALQSRTYRQLETMIIEVAKNPNVLELAGASKGNVPLDPTAVAAFLREGAEGARLTPLVNADASAAGQGAGAADIKNKDGDEKGQPVAEMRQRKHVPVSLAAAGAGAGPGPGVSHAVDPSESLHDGGEFGPPGFGIHNERPRQYDPGAIPEPDFAPPPYEA